jgi:hypothetical protein
MGVIHSLHVDEKWLAVFSSIHMFMEIKYEDKSNNKSN